MVSGLQELSSAKPSGANSPLEIVEEGALRACRPFPSMEVSAGAIRQPHPSPRGQPISIPLASHHGQHQGQLERDLLDATLTPLSSRDSSKTEQNAPMFSKGRTYPGGAGTSTARSQGTGVSTHPLCFGHTVKGTFCSAACWASGRHGIGLDSAPWDQTWEAVLCLCSSTARWQQRAQCSNPLANSAAPHLSPQS